MLFLFTFSISSTNAQALLKGKLVSKDDGLAVPYSSIFVQTSGGETLQSISNDDGDFTIQLSVKSGKAILYFSSLGYEQKKVSLDIGTINETERLIVSMSPVVINMPEVVVSEDQGIWKQGLIGDIENKILEDNQIRFCVRDNWAQIGVHIKGTPKRYENAYLKSFRIFITDQGFPSSPFTIRVMKSHESYRDGKVFPTLDLKDILREKVVFHPKQAGWFEMDLEKYQIPLTPTGVYLLIVPLSQEQYVVDINNEEYQCYGVVLGKQKIKKKHFRNFLYGPLSSAMAPLAKSNMAVVMEYFYMK